MLDDDADATANGDDGITIHAWMGGLHAVV